MRYALFSLQRESDSLIKQHFGGSIAELIRKADGSAASLVNILAEYFPCFRDQSRFERRSVKFYKRAQILAADIWAAFNGEHFGDFRDIDKLTMFAGKFRIRVFYWCEPVLMIY